MRRVRTMQNLAATRRGRLAALSAFVAAVAPVASCSAKTPEPVIIAAFSGLDGAPFEGSPAITEVQLRVRSADSERVVARASVGSGDIDVPDAAKQGIGALVLAGVDTSGAILASGRTPPLDLGGLQSPLSITVRILVQRTGSVVRALSLDAPLPKPRCALFGTRYLLVSDASSTDLRAIDLLTMTASKQAAAWRTPPLTVALAGAKVLGIDAAGKATLVDLETQTTTAPDPPPGVTFADVAGGQVITGEDGAAYIVGATRASSATDVVLRMDTNGTFALRHLSRARTGAAATWVLGRGLVIAYGSDASALEILAPAATTASKLPFPEHAVAGVIAPLDATHVVRVDESGAAWSIDLACTASCAEVALPWTDVAASPREGDVALALESGLLLARGGHVSRVRDGKITAHYEVFAAGLSAIVLPTGAAAIVTAGDAIVRMAR